MRRTCNESAHPSSSRLTLSPLVRLVRGKISQHLDLIRIRFVDMSGTYPILIVDVMNHPHSAAEYLCHWLAHSVWYEAFMDILESQITMDHIPR
jgi:hypothetical protein